MEHNRNSGQRGRESVSDAQNDGDSKSTDTSFYSAASSSRVPDYNISEDYLIPSYAESKRIVGTLHYREGVVYSYTREDVQKLCPQDGNTSEISIMVQIERNFWKKLDTQDKEHENATRPAKICNELCSNGCTCPSVGGDVHRLA